MRFLITFLVVIIAHFHSIAQDNLPTVPTAIFVGNAAFQAPVYGAKVALVLQEDFDNQKKPISKFIGEYMSDTAGMITVSLVPDKSYLITTTKDGYYTQLSKITTTNFSRTHKNRKGVSLRPRDVISIKGNIPLPEGITGVVKLTNKSNNHTRTEELDEEGNYEIKAVKGDDYELHIVIDGVMDTVVNIAQKQLEGNTANVPFVCNFAPQKVQPNYRAGDIFAMEAYNLKFIDRTPRLSSEVWMDTLARVLKDNPTVKIKIQVHTDARKSDRLNFLLAKDRSEIIYEELAERGVSPSQYSFELKGEDEILNHCLDDVDCTKQEHAVNNRVVLFIQSGAFVFKE